MDQKSIVLSLHLKGIAAQALSDDLVATPSDEALGYRMVTKYLRKAQLDTARVP
jgi:hypothetical protein